jgi:hypothetical protein
MLIKANGEATRRVIRRVNSERSQLGTFVVARTLTSETVASRRNRGRRV